MNNLPGPTGVVIEAEPMGTYEFSLEDTSNYLEFIIGLESPDVFTSKVAPASEYTPPPEKGTEPISGSTSFRQT